MQEVEVGFLTPFNLYNISNDATGPVYIVKPVFFFVLFYIVSIKLLC